MIVLPVVLPPAGGANLVPTALAKGRMATARARVGVPALGGENVAVPKSHVLFVREFWVAQSNETPASESEARRPTLPDEAVEDRQIGVVAGSHPARVVKARDPAA